MSKVDRWSDANNSYLRSELGILRDRIEALASRTTPGTAVAAPAKPSDPATSPRIAKHATAEPASTKERFVPALVMLGRQLGLSDFERQVLLMCAAVEFDTGFGALCARAQAGAAGGPTFELALAALDEPAWDVMSPERPLRYWRLVEIYQPAAQPLVASALRADERIMNYIKGLNYLDDRIASLVDVSAGDDMALPLSQATIADAIAEQAAAGGRPPLIQLTGSDGKLAVASAVAVRAGLVLYCLRGEAVPAALADGQTFARLWAREAALQPLALFVDADEIEPSQRSAVKRLLGQLDGLVFAAVPAAWRDLARPALTFEIAKPTPVEQRRLWGEALGKDAEPEAGLLAGQFNLGQAAIRMIAARVGAGADRDAKLWSAVLEETRPVLDALAQPIVPKAGWDDIELPERERAQLAEIAAQVRNRTAVYDDWEFRARLSRGLGISVLFAGDSGTGKTMAAEALAHELGLLLYRIDLSGVVSKFIGETEKNLRRLFDAAEDGGAILLFDEADALFGKRSEVKDSHDRYANIEINYLLQRMEAYSGVAILTTNMKAALDQAFVRRLRFIVNFPFPGAAQRAAIWRKAFPAAVDIGALDFERLARLNLTGGSIHNIALNAAFAAVAAGGAPTMPIALAAARAEFLKLDKPINEADFRWLERVGGAA